MGEEEEKTFFGAVALLANLVKACVNQITLQWGVFTCSELIYENTVNIHLPQTCARLHRDGSFPSKI